jgi:allantoate deiminase
MIELAQAVIGRCIALSQFTEEPGRITRTFLSSPMRDVHELVGNWMREARLDVSIDAAGNIRGARGPSDGRRMMIGSHLDTVPNAGAYDGILGVVMGIALARLTNSIPLTVVGFSEEEGVKFGVPFIGSRALIGTVQPLIDADQRIAQSIREFGLDPVRIGEARIDASAYFEIHIEQGPVLEHLNLRLGVVEAIAGQSRWTIKFIGSANHAGTTPMHLRRDALVCAAEWILAVQRIGLESPGLVATVGRCEVEPGAGNVVPGRVTASLDVRHKDDTARRSAVEGILEHAHEIGAKHQVIVEPAELLDVSATPMNPALIDSLSNAVVAEGFPPHRMTSGAGHDAMVIAQAMPAVMLFVRSPGGISHHPDESVLVADVAAAMLCAKRFVENWNG